MTKLPNSFSEAPEIPAEAGWYACLICYDSVEGSFPQPRYWDGKKWNNARAIICVVGPFDTEKEADDWGYAHDPDI